jgi:RNA polymerase sigma factor (sigma-70 family)
MKPSGSNRTAGWVAAIVEKYQGELHRFLVRRLRAGQDSADLAQEVYLRLLRLEKSEIVQQPQAYVYTIASHVASQFRMRAERGLVTFDSKAADEAAERPSNIPANELSERIDSQIEVERILNLLPPTHRAVFVLCKRDGLSYADIARQLDLSVHTVKKYIHEATVRIRTQAWAQEDAP